MEEVLVEWAKAVHRENPVVDAHLDLAVEVYATTLHYAPCQASEAGFRCVIVLPEGTNHELDFSVASEGEEKLMTAKNKWLIAHEDAKIGGAFCGLKGENISLEQ